MIAVRIALGLLVALAGYRIGSLFADRLLRRIEELDAWQTLLQLLASDVEYTALALPRAFSGAARSVREPVAGFARRLGRRLGDHVTLQEAFAQELDRLRPLSCLREEDFAALEELAESLGRFGRSEHARHFAHCLSRIAEQRRRASEERQRSERLFRTLGATAGIAVALLLI